MPDWLHRLHHSRRARNLTLGALGMLTLGSCGGAVLANYVVAESNIAQYRDRDGWSTLASVPEPPPKWVEDAAAEIGPASFTTNDSQGYSDAVY